MWGANNEPKGGTESWLWYECSSKNYWDARSAVPDYVPFDKMTHYERP